MRKSNAAFSFLELMLVIGIITLLMVVAVPGFDYILRGGVLTRTGVVVQSVLAQARQETVSRNRDVEVRWLSWDQPGEGTIWGVQAFRIEPRANGAEFAPIGRITRFPNTIRVVENESGFSYSPLITGATWSGTMAIGGGRLAQYRAFRIRPDGRLSPLPPPPYESNNFLTLALKTTPPTQNFFTIAINPLTTQIRSFRP